MLPNVIIGGAQKAGTTSLFRYLSNHPSVCPSRIKEIHFFLKEYSSFGQVEKNDYGSYFTDISPNQTVFLEASPMYLAESAAVAKKMRDALPDAKLVFIVREPIGVLKSYIKFKSAIDGINYPLALFEALAKGDDTDAFADNGVNLNNARYHLESGCYINSLKHFLACYPKDQIGVFFFDELSGGTLGFMKKICEFIGIDGDFYDTFQFKIENKTRIYKAPKLHILVTRLNMKIEPVFNRFPKLRDIVRKIYLSLFESKAKAASESEADIQALKAYYVGHNRELSIFLKQIYPGIEMPKWLNFED